MVLEVYKLYFHVNHPSNFEKYCNGSVSKSRESFLAVFCGNNNVFLLVTYFPHGPNKDLGKLIYL